MTPKILELMIERRNHQRTEEEHRKMNQVMRKKSREVKNQWLVRKYHEIKELLSTEYHSEGHQ